MPATTTKPRRTTTAPATPDTRTPEEIEAAIAQIKANAELAIASAEEKRAAAREHIADAKARDLEAEHTKFLIDHAKIDNAIAEIAFTKCEREESFAKSLDMFHKVYTFNDQVTEKSVKNCIDTLSVWSRQSPQCDLTLYINSGGGSIIDGFALIDFITQLRRQGHKVTTVAIGWAASMSAVLLQAGDVRVIGKNAFLLLHEGSLELAGTTGQAQDTMKLLEKMHTNIWELFASRALPINPKTTAAYLRKIAKRTDVAFSSSEALELGLVDEIR